MAIEGTRRAATLTNRLLAFSRQQALDPKVVDANKLVSAVCELLRRTLGESVELEAVLGAGLWRTHADPNQLENTIVNLAVNARDAMPTGGKVTIETQNSYLDDAYVAALSDPVKPGQYIQIAVTDTGAGMDRSTIERPSSRFSRPRKSGRGPVWG
jgi:signal transduction histidine kinase